MGDKLSTEEKRRLLAQMVRVNLVDCCDDSGAFDMARARRVLPGCAVQQLFIQEVIRTDRQGISTVRRHIRVRLEDRVRAMRLDDVLLEREREQEQQKQADADSLAQREKNCQEAKERLCAALKKEKGLWGGIFPNIPQQLVEPDDLPSPAEPDAASLNPQPAPINSPALPSPSINSQLKTLNSQPAPSAPLPHSFCAEKPSSGF
jgi:hypothetical protein